MEYVEGETLAERVRRSGPLSERTALALADQTLDVLGYLHSHEPPIIHRDVTPANIRIATTGRAVLVDFGVAKYLSPLDRTAPGSRKRGTPGYAPPEQYDWGTDQRSDLYSLGATLYFALTGRTPVDAKRRVGGEKLPTLRALNPALSPAVGRAVAQALHLHPKQRFSSAAHMQAALAATAGGVPLPSPLHRLRSAFASLERLKPLALTLLRGLAALCALSLLVLIMTRWGTSNPTDAAAIQPATPSSPEAPTPTPEVAEVVVPPASPTPLPPTSTPIAVPAELGVPEPDLARPPVTSPRPAIAPPGLISPREKCLYGPPVAFAWDDTRTEGQVYYVIAVNTQTGYRRASAALATNSVTWDLPPAAFGEWVWRVLVAGEEVVLPAPGEISPEWVLQNHVLASGEGRFYYQPLIPGEFVCEDEGE
jgi:serine/threonine protein kinase